MVALAHQLALGRALRTTSASSPRAETSRAGSTRSLAGPLDWATADVKIIEWSSSGRR